jgi:hypothetical protein
MISNKKTSKGRTKDAKDNEDDVHLEVDLTPQQAANSTVIPQLFWRVA